MSIISVVGARPNYMKMAPVISAIDDNRLRNYLVHTGQHYDDNMSKVFFEELGLPEPDKFLGVGSGSHAFQTAKILTEFEKICIDEKPDLVIVAGDVNSTLASALAASKLNIPIAHIESGLRSFNRSMPKEINRIVTEESGMKHLKSEGIPDTKVHFVGNSMIDSVYKFLPEVLKKNPFKKYGLVKMIIALSLCIDLQMLIQKKIGNIISMLNRMSEKIQIIIPVHPRTKKALKD